jgi:hypothetical protein
MELLNARANGRLLREESARGQRAAIVAGGLAVMLALALGAWLSTNHARPVAAAQHAAKGPRVGLASLPLGSRAVVSASLGAQDPRYRVVRSGAGLAARNPQQGLAAKFAAGGAEVATGAGRVRLALHGIGWGSSLQALGPVRPAAGANTVTFAHGAVNEQYANGPLGLEQSFSIARAPGGSGTGPLTLALDVRASAPMHLAEGGRALTFARAGSTGLRYAGLFATDASGRRLGSWLELSAGRLLVRVQAQGARFPITIDPFFQQGSKLTGGEESGAGEFGASVALSADGNTAIVGGPLDNTGTGAAWVFTRSEGKWSQQGPKLTGGEETGAGRFGFSVSLSADGNTALIGGPLDNSSTGAAWAFTRSEGKWTQKGAKLTGSGETGKGEFGIGVTLSRDGKTAIVGGSGDNKAVGAAWVFTFSEETGFTQQGAKLTGGEEIEGGRFGFSVALSEDGNTAMIGGGSDHVGIGAAWAFTRSEGTWTQQGPKLTGTGEVGPGHFGFSDALSADGNTAVIGGLADNTEVGAVWAFTRSEGKWTQQGSKLTGSSESGTGLFGAKVAVSSDGNRAFIGGPGDSLRTGAAWAFSRSGSTWSQEGPKVTASEESGKGEFGVAVGLSADGQTAFVGGQTDNSSAGAAWPFVNLPLIPNVVTKPATAVSTTTATLHATVNPNGSEVTDCHFNYGTTTSYGTTAPCSPAPGSGTNAVAVSAAITGLSPATTYHFQIVATNINGTGEGADETFTTANPPEFGRCVKLAAGVKGGYSNSGCTAAATAEKFGFEWERGPGPKHKFTAAIKPATTAILETTAKRKVVCTGATINGEYTGERTLGGVVITLTGCEMSASKCTSAAAAEGEIVSSTLEGELGIEKKSAETPLKNKIAFDLLPVGGSGPVAEFTCGTTTAVVSGSVLAPATINRMLVKDTLKYVEVVGKQKPEKFEGLPKDVLGTSFAGGGSEQTGLKVILNKTNEEGIEVNSVF